MKGVVEEELLELSGQALIDYCKTEILAELGEIKVNRRNMILCAGEHNVGKTSFALCLSNSALLKGYKVAYIDSDEKPLLHRGVPNLYSVFSERNPDLYKNAFRYIGNFVESKVIEQIDEFGARFVVIDNIYNAFHKKFPDIHPYERAKKIKMFVMELAHYINCNDKSCILTSPTKPLKKNVRSYDVLGGEILKGIAQNKIFIFRTTGKEEREIDLGKETKRVIQVDELRNYSFRIDEFGELIPLDNLRAVQGGKK